MSWKTPVDRGSEPLTAYRVARSDGKVVTVSAAAHSVTLTGLNPLAVHTVTVAATNADGSTGPAATLRIYPTVTAITSSTTRAIKGRAFTVTAKVTRRGASTLVAGMPVTLQRHVAGETVWRTVSTAATTTKGTRAWAVKQSQLTYYRVVSQGVTTWLGSTSSVKAVAVR